jgi:hypothetical protein
MLDLVAQDVREREEDVVGQLVIEDGRVLVELGADDDVELLRQLGELADGQGPVVAAEGMAADGDAVLFELRIVSRGKRELK